MAFVVVQHLSPKHESLLPTLLSRWSEAKVSAVEDGMPVEPGRIYVIPPNSDLAILQGVLHLMTPIGATHGPRLPIDYFFRSLAEDQRSARSESSFRAPALTERLASRPSRRAGGITFAQEPTSAKYDGMPRSAIESGWADFTLSPEGIANELLSDPQSPLPHPQAARASPQAQEQRRRS